MDLWSAILSFLLGLAANFTTNAIITKREANLKKLFTREDLLKKALDENRSLEDEIRNACTQLARNRDRLGLTPQEMPLWNLLNDVTFQSDLIEWFMIGGIEEGDSVKERLMRRMESVLGNIKNDPLRTEFLRNGYFEMLEKAVFSNPILANWRHQLTLDYLRKQVAVLRQRAEEAAGNYSPEKKKSALDRYCEKALSSWDIIDLSNLPEGDVHLATQQLLLRQLYMPIRIALGPELSRLEEQRLIKRIDFADHLSTKSNPTEAKEYSVGDCLKSSRRIVVLGDPGGGKTTMLRWMATSYLLKNKGDDALKDIPDTKNLPDRNFIPVLIRCRDLGEADLCRCFTDFLTQHLNKTELLPEDAQIMRAVVLEQLTKGGALLLIDGLDEITNLQVRMLFCQEIERTAARYPDAPIVVTSRIVGYRDMPYRMGSSFSHGVIAELNKEDKDLFVQRWVDVTEQHQPVSEKLKRAKELIDALHSSDRIEHLTGNPMLLTTLALVKRKVGKLPNKRTKLYAEAVSVLLNWNLRLYQAIEEDEAIPQLEYLAYEMCRRGIQRMTEDEVLNLLDKIRTEYPNIRAIRRREPYYFLKLLEARSSILIKAGGLWQRDKNEEKPVWEFRHLTFQEYLAARALIDGRYPMRDKTKSLAEQVAPLAGTVKYTRQRDISNNVVPDSWREALRLLVADCKDDDVEDVLLAILNPMPDENSEETRDTRTILAAMCLADEPNVSNELVGKILTRLAEVSGRMRGRRLYEVHSALDILARSTWGAAFQEHILSEYCSGTLAYRPSLGSIIGQYEYFHHSQLGFEEWYRSLPDKLKSDDPKKVIAAALGLMHAAYSREIPDSPELSTLLVSMLKREPFISEACAWSLVWLNGGFTEDTRFQRKVWKTTAQDFEFIVNAAEQAPPQESELRRFLATLIGNVEKTEVNAKLLLDHIHSPTPEVRKAVIRAILKYDDKQDLSPLLDELIDSEIRHSAIEVLREFRNDLRIPVLVGRLSDYGVRRNVLKLMQKFRGKEDIPLLLKIILTGRGFSQKKYSRAKENS